MHLTDEEKQMLEGGDGEGVQQAMDFLVKLGNAFGAERMVEIASAHPAGCGYRVAGEGALRFLKWLAGTGAKVRVPATLDPICCDLERNQVLRIPDEFFQKQSQMNDAFRTLGFGFTFTCLPYWTSVAPKFGDHIAWGESNAVAYANSVLGARGNREASLTCVLAAVAGRVPEYGVHLPENRHGQILVRVETSLEDPADWRAMGAYVGKHAWDKIPVFTGLPSRISSVQLKDICGAITGPWGTMPMFHILGVTPEASDLETAVGGRVLEDVETIVFRKKEIEEAYEMMCTARLEHIDLVTVGCPYMTIEEIRTMAEVLRGKRVCKGVEFWGWTDRATRLIAERMGLVEVIEAAGAQLLSDTCMVTTPLEKSAYKFKVVATDSAKAASYVPGVGKPDVWFGTLAQCVQAALTGRWRGRTSG